MRTLPALFLHGPKPPTTSFGCFYPITPHGKGMGIPLCSPHLTLTEEALAELAGSKARALSKDSGEVALRGEAQARGYGGRRHLGLLRLHAALDGKARGDGGRAHKEVLHVAHGVRGHPFGTINRLMGCDHFSCTISIGPSPPGLSSGRLSRSPREPNPLQGESRGRQGRVAR